MNLPPPLVWLRSQLVIVAGLSFCILGLAPAASAQGLAYTVTDLGTLGGPSSTALGINSAGQVVGFSELASSSNLHATLFSVDGKGVTRLDLSGPEDNFSRASAINDLGQVVGSYQPLPLGQRPGNPHATLWTLNGGTVTPTDLGRLPSTVPSSTSGANGINNAGQIVGSSYASNDTTQHAALWTVNGGNVSAIDLDDATYQPQSSTQSAAYTLNDVGQIVGFRYPPPRAYARATRFTVDGSTVTRTDLGPTGEFSGQAVGINTSGQTVGYYFDLKAAGNPPARAALFSTAGSSTTVTDLGSLSGRSSFAMAINASGQIIGNAVRTDVMSQHGFLYLPGGVKDINALVGANPAAATDITVGSALNDWGQFPGNGKVSGQAHALLLSPTVPPTRILGLTQDTWILGGANYRQVPPFTNPTLGSYNTTITLLDGVAGSSGAGSFGVNRHVTENFAPVAASSLASDTATLTGTAKDVVVLQFSFDYETAKTVFQGPENSRLGWYDGTRWVNAVVGNDGGMPNFAGNRAYNPATDFRLGTYGVDVQRGVAWAVVNHGGLFAVTTDNPPSPSTLPQITSAPTASAQADLKFLYQITASNQPTDYSFDRLLPAGLSFNRATGVIYGIPTETGTFVIRLFATNGNGTGTATLVLTVSSAPLPPPVINSPINAGGQVGQAFLYQIAARNRPTGFGATGLPPGLSIDASTGLISGTPTQSGSFAVNLSATNEAGTGTAALRLLIDPAPPTAPVITSATAIGAQEGQAFSYQITATNAPTRYDAAPLPDGLSIDGATGLVSGTLTAAPGSYRVLVSATNAGGSGSATVTIIVTRPAANVPVITGDASATGRVAEPFTFQIVATNDPFGYGASGLPDGLSLDATTGLITGAPTQPGSFAVGLYATNADGTGMSTLNLTVAAAPEAAPVITSVLKATGQEGQAFSYQITASGTPASYAASGLPTGLSLDATTGLVTGVPSQAGTFRVALTATNGGGSGTATLELTVTASNPAVSLVATIPRVVAGSGTVGRFTLSLPAPAARDLTICYTIKGSAVNGTDYSLLKGTAKIKVGKTSKVIKVKPLGDLGGAAKKVVTLILAPGEGYTPGTTGKVKVKIFNQ